MRVWFQIWSTILNGCIQLSGAFYLLENCGHLDKDLSTSSNPYLKKVCLLYLMRTLFDKGVTYRSNLLNTISEKKNRQPEALVMGVVRGAVMTDVSSKKSVLKCIGKWIHQLFFAPLKKPRHVLWQGRSKLRASFLRGISAKKSAFHSKKSIGKKCFHQSIFRIFYFYKRNLIFV